MSGEKAVDTFNLVALAFFLAAAAVFAFFMIAVSAQTLVSTTFAWDANPNPDHGQAVAGYKLLVDQQQEVDAGNALQVAVPLAPGPHSASLRAYWADGTPSPASAPLFRFTVAAPGPDPCAGHPVTIAVESWSQQVQVGARGRILFALSNPFPIVQVQVKLGAQVIGQFDGADLRDTPGSWFSVPRAPGPYLITVAAKDAAGCLGQTSLPRTVTVVP